MRNTCWPHRMFPTDTLFRVFLSRAWSLSRGTVIRLGAFCQLSMIPSFEKPCTYRPLRLSFCHSLVFGLAVDVLDHSLTACCMSGLCQLLNNSAWPLCVCTTAHGLSPTSRAALSSYSDVLTLAPMPKTFFPLSACPARFWFLSRRSHCFRLLQRLAATTTSQFKTKPVKCWDQVNGGDSITV